MILAIGLTLADRHAAFHLLPGRVWELWAGALAAVIFPADLATGASRAG